MEKHSGNSEKSEKFIIPGIGSVRFLLKHRCRSLRAANLKKKEYEPTHYVRVEREGKFYHVYLYRRK